jgi:hypothetical protein
MKTSDEDNNCSKNDEFHSLCDRLYSRLGRRSIENGNDIMKTLNLSIVFPGNGRKSPRELQTVFLLS